MGILTARLPTAKQVYDRICWDAGFDRRCFTLGFETRDRGIQEMPLTAFVPGGDIPWHRWRYLRCGETVVWDRRTRTDRLAEVRKPHSCQR